MSASVAIGRIITIVLFGILFLAIAGATLFFFGPTSVLAEEAEEPLQCLTCHSQVLIGHDKLGEGSQACWSCHLSTQMKTLHLASGQVKFPLSESPRLCAQCHQKRYDAWLSGTHGVPAWREGDPEVRGSEKAICAQCHNPHRPQVVLTSITLSHPDAVPQPPEIPVNLLLGVAGSFVLIVAVVIWKGGGKR
ncbi:MAG: hypothetical protein HYX84_00175 [Chloroflexi bacterium]|nr:hypothetical protein [Chloroflexota bacterium]